MTRLKATTIKCGNCGNEFEIHTYGSVNVSVDPELKDKIFREEINSGFCPKCGTRHQIMLPFLYHDMQRNLLVWVRLEEERSREDEFLKGLKETTEEAHLAPEKYVYGVVFGVKELREKLVRAGEWSKEELRLCSKKDGQRAFVAAIRIENNELVVEADDPGVREDLLREVNHLIEHGGIFMFYHRFKNGDYTLIGGLMGPQDPYFLFALQNSSYLWRSNKQYGGYIIYGFCSSLSRKDRPDQTLECPALILGEVRENPTTKKLTTIIYEHSHKDKDYRKHILARVAISASILAMQKSLVSSEREKWRECFYESLNENKGFINSYARRGPVEDFIECCLAYNEDEETLKECNEKKYNLLKQLLEKGKKEADRSRLVESFARILQVKFPQSYRSFLLNQGTTVVGRNRILGLPSGDVRLSVLDATQLLRKRRDDLPHTLVAVSFRNDRALCLDLAHGTEEDAPLVDVSLTKGEETLPVTDSFRAFLERMRKQKPSGS